MASEDMACLESPKPSWRHTVTADLLLDSGGNLAIRRLRLGTNFAGSVFILFPVVAGGFMMIPSCFVTLVMKVVLGKGGVLVTAGTSMLLLAAPSVISWDAVADGVTMTATPATWGAGVVFVGALCCDARLVHSGHLPGGGCRWSRHDFHTDSVGGLGDAYRWWARRNHRCLQHRQWSRRDYHTGRAGLALTWPSSTRINLGEGRGDGL